MEFLLYRSDNETFVDLDIPPVPEAYKKAYGETVHTLHPSDGWFEIGKNHREHPTEKDTYVRDQNVMGWFVNILSMNDLLTFIDNYGECKINWNSKVEGCFGHIILVSEEREKEYWDTWNNDSERERILRSHKNRFVE